MNLPIPTDGWYIVTITFKLTKQIYTLDNVRAFGDGLTKSGSNYYVKNASSTYNAFNWEDPYDEPLDSAFSGDNTQIYTDAACTKPLTSQPVYETYYYVKYRIWNTLPKDHSLDFTKVTEKDSTLFISGYTVECYSADLIVDGTGRDELDVTFRMTRNLSASMSGFDPVATRVKEESGVIYKPQIENIASFISWKNDVAGNERDYTIMTQGLYTDSACTNRLRNEPAMGVTYYLSYVITGRIPEPDLTINSLTVADCSLTIPGYSTTCLGVTKTTDSNNCDKLEVKFSITRQEAVPEYVMDGFAAKANGVVASGSSYKLNIDSAIKSFVLWQDGVNAPASDYAVENTSRLFTSSACTVGITSQPAPGDEVYAEFTVTSLKSRDIIDLSKVVNDKCTLTVPGYQTEFVRAIRSNTGIEQDSLQIVFKLTCQYSMTGMAMISSGVSYYEADNQYRINNTDVMRDRATWMDGSEPAFNDFTGILTCLYTDKDCKNILHSRPEAGKSYYAYALFYNEKDNDHSVGLTGITADNCTLDVDGYETRCVGIRNAVFASTHDSVYITFKLTKLERYTMTSFTRDASELVKYSSGYFLKSVSNDYLWDGDIAPAHDAVICSDYPVVDNNETPISDMLAPGSTAYAYVVLSNKTPGDHTIDFSAMDTDDCVITMDGYDIECVAASEDTNERGCDCFMMIFEITRLIPDGYYVMSGFEAEALGFVLNGGSVMLDTPAYEAFRALWKDAAPVLNTDYQVAANGIYTDEEGTEWLKHIPSESETFYVQFLVNNAKDGDTTIDLSQFNTTNCTFDVDGYTTECIRVERKTVGGLDSVYITFEVTKNEPDHNMDGFNIEASGVSLDGSNYVLDLPSDLKSCVTWCEDPAPDASQFIVTVSGLYTDEELTVPLTEKPVNGGEYYVAVTTTGEVIHDIVSLQSSDPSTAILTVPGFISEYAGSNVGTADDQKDYATYIIKLTKVTYTMTGFEASGSGVKAKGSNYTFDNTADTATFITWDGETPDKSLLAIDDACMLYDSVKCLNKINTEPVADGTYYTYYMIINESDDNALDFSELSAPKCKLDVPGYITDCANIEIGELPSHCEYVIITFRMVKYPANTLIGFAAAATGVVQQGTGYRLTNVDPVSSYPIWSEEVDPSLFDMSFDHRLFTDESCYNELKTEPTVGETYYVYYWLTNETPNDHSLVFDRLLTSDCTLDLTGYRTECVGITPQETAGGNDALQIAFSISPKAAYTVTGYNATATSISKTADDTYTLNFDSAFRNGFSWEDGNVPASSACQVLMSTIYTDQTFTSQSALRYEPVSGQDIYMRFTLRNPVADDHSVDFSRITADDCSLTLDGFTVECIGVTKGDGAKDYILVTFKLTKDVPAPDHVLSGINVDASGVVQNGNDIYSVMFKPTGSIFKSASWDGTAPSESALMCREGFLYSEASCENELMTEPVAGSTYYVRYSIMNTTMSDHSIDFTKLKGTDCTMTLPGYTVSGAAVTVSTHMSRDIVYIVYTVTKDAEVVPNAIVGISLDNAQELANDGTGYYPDIDQDLNDCLYWDDYDNIPSGGVFDVKSGYLCSDADCENILTAEPSVASESYITYTISSTLPSSKLDLSGIEKEYCELIVQDYRCTCVAVYYSEDTAGCGTAKITFELVRLPDVYVMTDIEAEATGVSLNDFFYQVDLKDKLASAASWQYDITPYLGNIESSENGALFYNESCEGFVYDAPFDHGVYYVKLSMNNKIAGSHYIDFSKLSTENCSLTLDGYSSECISVTLTDTENHDGVELVFRLVKAADEPYPYAVSGFDAVETGLELVSGAYKPASGENAKAFVSWADDKAATSFYAAPLAVCTDEACTTQLTKEPEAGDVCYVRYVVGNNISLNHDIDFMSLTADDCTLDLEGYTSECLSVKYATDYLSRDEITILFKVTKEEDVVYVMTGADITSTGIVKNGTEYYVPAHDSKISSSVDWKDDVVPEASVFYADVTNLYLDDKYGKLLRSEPVPGHTYYVSYVFRNQVNNAHDIDFTQLTADDLTLKLDGYTTKCISIQCVDDERDTTFAMFSIKKDAEPTPTATATPTPTAKPTATATPKATATAKPTATPKATVTAKPTATPSVKVTATPVPTTKVTATPKPSEKVTPTITPTTAPDVTPTTAPSEDPKVQILDFVKRIYIYVLDREPEKEGSEYWSNELYNFNRTGAEVAQGFIFSEEFSNRGTSDRQFVEILYKTFFGRDADEAGMNYWLEQLATGTMDRTTVANGFIYSQEWADTCASYGIRSGGELKPQGEIKPTDLTYAFVERMYTTAMGRGYDEQGRQYWAGELANFNITGEQVGASFFLSEEMINYKLSDQEYLNRLYATFMNREADADGSAYWLGVMASGATRESIVYGFTRSPEFTEKCVEARILPFV